MRNSNDGEQVGEFVEKFFFFFLLPLLPYRGRRGSWCEVGAREIITDGCALAYNFPRYNSLVTRINRRIDSWIMDGRRDTEVGKGNGRSATRPGLQIRWIVNRNVGGTGVKIADTVSRSAVSGTSP